MKNSMEGDVKSTVMNMNTAQKDNVVRYAKRWDVKTLNVGRAVEPKGRPEAVDMMNGNAVLLTDAVVRCIGNLDPAFEHAMGDTDYALRAVTAGLTVLQTGTYVGQCSNNPNAMTMHDRNASVSVRLRHALSRKGLPPKSWLTLCRKHAGRLWPLHFVWGYAKLLVKK